MCANMIYAGGEPDWNVVAFGDMIGKGNFSGAGRQLGNIWANALQSPDFWLTAAFSLGYTAISFALQQNIPSGWLSKSSKKGGGIVYYDPSNSHNSIRIMPGNPYSPNPSQQIPYLK